MNITSLVTPSFIKSIDSIDPNDDYPVLISNKRKKGNFTDRMIMHNRFKNITAEEAILLLEEKEAGEVFKTLKKSYSLFST